MQLKNMKPRISGLLSAATCTLLGTTGVQGDEWDVDTAVLLYSEKDRVSAFEPVVSMKKELNETDILSMKLTLDSLTGASANGAVPSAQAQTFTRPSGNGQFTTPANETPLDDTFHDTRAQFNMNWDKAMDSENRRNLGFSISREFDFTSVGANASWTHEMNQKNTALTGGIALELDSISPIGGIPAGLTNQPYGTTINNTIVREGADDNRQILDLLVGVTQIIDRSSLFQVNLSYSLANGYMTDPFKVVSIVDSTTGEPLEQIYENRPDTRDKISVFGKYKKTLVNDDIITASLRLMTSDWGVDSETLDITYRWKMDRGYYLQPHLRYYQQSAADFYRYFLRDDETRPQNVDADYITADYRLGEMEAQTMGLKFGKTDRYGNDWSVRVEQYVQTGDGSPAVAIGQLQNQNLYPDVEATIFQVNYSFKW